MCTGFGFTILGLGRPVQAIHVMWVFWRVSEFTVLGCDSWASTVVRARDLRAQDIDAG